MKNIIPGQGRENFGGLFRHQTLTIQSSMKTAAIVKQLLVALDRSFRSISKPRHPNRGMRSFSDRNRSSLVYHEPGRSVREYSLQGSYKIGCAQCSKHVGALQSTVDNMRAEALFEHYIGPVFGGSTLTKHRETTKEINEYMDDKEHRRRGNINWDLAARRSGEYEYAFNDQKINALEKSKKNQEPRARKQLTCKKQEG